MIEEENALTKDWTGFNGRLNPTIIPEWVHPLNHDSELDILDPLFNEPKVKYDKDGNIIYHRSDDGFWVERKYSKYGKVIHERNSLGFAFEAEYNENSKVTWYANTDGYWKRCTYNAQGLKSSEEDSNGKHRNYEYDMWGNLLDEQKFSTI